MKSDQPFPTELKVVGTFHVPFIEFLYELGCRGRHTECACYFCRKRQIRIRGLCPIRALRESVVRIVLVGA